MPAEPAEQRHGRGDLRALGEHKAPRRGAGHARARAGSGDALDCARAHEQRRPRGPAGQLDRGAIVEQRATTAAVIGEGAAMRAR
jgi:hypothetical protein